MLKSATRLIRPAMSRISQYHSKPNHPSTLIFLFGAGKGTFSNNDSSYCLRAFAAQVERFKKSGINIDIKQIGYETKGASEEVIQDELQKIAKDTSGAVSFLIYSHAFPIKKPNTYEALDLGITLNLERIPAKKLFTMIAGAFPQRQTDILVTCCRGSLAIPQTNILTSGSTVAALAGELDLIDHNDLSDFIGTIMQSDDLKDLSVITLTQLYLAHNLKDYSASPVIAISEGPTFSLRDIWHSKLGKSFSPQEEDLIHKNLDTLIEKEKVDNVMKIMSTATHMASIKPENYGASLLIAFTAAMAVDLQKMPVKLSESLRQENESAIK